MNSTIQVPLGFFGRAAPGKAPPFEHRLAEVVSMLSEAYQSILANEEKQEKIQEALMAKIDALYNSGTIRALLARQGVQ